MELLVVAFLLGIGPLALLLGVDSREDDPRGWWPAVPRRPAPGLPPGGRPVTGRAARVAGAARRAYPELQATCSRPSSEPETGCAAPMPPTGLA